ncbi:hypothetical protein ACJX0J_035415, partial [Zea mays]
MFVAQHVLGKATCSKEHHVPNVLTEVLLVLDPYFLLHKADMLSLVVLYTLFTLQLGGTKNSLKYIAINAKRRQRAFQFGRLYTIFFQNIFWRKYAINNYKNQNQSFQEERRRNNSENNVGNLDMHLEVILCIFEIYFKKQELGYRQ